MSGRASIRLRLALWCAALVTVAGAIVVVAVLALTSAELRDRARETAPPPAAQTGGAPPPGAADPAAVRAEDQRRGAIVEDTLDHARRTGFIVLGALALCSIGIGWIVAGRMLAPVARLARTAREVSATSLEHRIGLEGPDDELKELADAFDAMLDRLATAFAAQRRFVDDASHELRTPLATMRAEVDAVLEDPGATPAELRAAAAGVSRALDRAEALTTALLTLSRSDSVQVREPADLAAIARDVVTGTPGTARLDLRTSLEAAPVRGDAALLERLAGNLVENAARYNEPGGLLEVTTAARDGTSTLTVVNDGPPVAPGEAAGLVARFRREQRGGDGFGLGLAIADAIARGHGGTLTLRARPAGGLEVTAELPRAPDP